MIEAVQNIFNVPDLRKRILFMLALLGVYRIGAYIPTPGIDSAALENFFSQASGTLFGFLDLFTGGNFRRLTIFALGIMPYITASIILQLLTVVWPYLEKLSKEGELGRRKITTYTRYLTVVLSAVQSAGIAIALQRQGTFVINPGFGFVLMTMLTLTTGTAFIMWLGEQISERGVGPGWVMVGDAFGFVDPMLSPGVFLALRSAEILADALRPFVGPGVAPAPVELGAALRRYAETQTEMLTAWSELVAYLYDGRLVALLKAGEDWLHRGRGVFKRAMQHHIERHVALQASGAATTAPYGRRLLRFLSRYALRGIEPAPFAIR